FLEKAVADATTNINVPKTAYETYKTTYEGPVGTAGSKLALEAAYTTAYNAWNVDAASRADAGLTSAKTAAETAKNDAATKLTNLKAAFDTEVAKETAAKDKLAKATADLTALKTAMDAAAVPTVVTSAKDAMDKAKTEADAAKKPVTDAEKVVTDAKDALDK